MTRIFRMMVFVIFVGVMLLQVGCCCFCATPVRRNPMLDRLRNLGGLASDRSTSRTMASFADLDDTRVLKLQVKSDRTHIDLQARMQLDEGSVRWTLVDPQGRVRWEGSAVQRRTIRDQQRFEAIAGTWRLEIEFRDASGEYEIEWVAR
jgi:hypothetical protein